MTFVLDGSTALAWCFEDEGTDEVTAVMRRAAAEGALVPSIWRLEVANGLMVGMRRGRMSEATRGVMLNAFAAMDIAVDPETTDRAWSSILGIAERHRLTLYDASYLELAFRRAVPLATLDAAMARAASALGVPLILPRTASA